jgi:hypothetical protein
LHVSRDKQAKNVFEPEKDKTNVILIILKVKLKGKTRQICPIKWPILRSQESGRKQMPF